MNTLSLVLLGSVALAAECDTLPTGSLRQQALALSTADSMALEKRTAEMLQRARSYLAAEDTSKAIALLEAIAVGCEIDGSAQAFRSTRAFGSYTTSLHMLEALYGATRDCRPARFTKAKLDGLTDTKSVSPCKDTTGATRPAGLPESRRGKYLFWVEAPDTHIAAGLASANPIRGVFPVAKLRERTLIRLWFPRRCFIHSLRVTCEESDSAIVRAWTDVRMDNLAVVRAGHAVLRDMWVNRYLDISVVFQDEPFIVTRIDLE